MRIRKFNEGNLDVQNISTERIEEIKKLIFEMSSDIKKKSQSIDSLLNELDVFSDKSNKSNDQIDNIISNLQLIRSNYIDATDKLDNISIDIDDYSKNGRNMLY